jgi:hypothetical protein
VSPAVKVRLLKVDLIVGYVGEFDEFVLLGGSGLVVVEFGNDEVGGVGRSPCYDVSRLQSRPNTVL